MDKDISSNAPEYIKHAAEIVDYANLDKEERDMIDLLERIEAEQKAREDWVINETRKNDIKNSIEIMTDFNIPFEKIIEKIAQKYSMTVEQVNELLNDSSH